MRYFFPGGLMLCLLLAACGGGSGGPPATALVPPAKANEAVGLLDAAFGTEGLAAFGNARWVTEIAELEDGSLLVGGTLPFVAKVTPLGRLDPAFAAGGILVTGSLLHHDVANITVLPSSQVLVVERHLMDPVGPAPLGDYSTLVARRLDASGRADPTYGTNGAAELPRARASLVVTPPGRVASFLPEGLISPTLASGVAVASLDPAGLRDPGFEAIAHDALRCEGRFDVPMQWVQSVAAARAGDQVVVAMQWRNLAGAYGVCVARLTSGGTLDPGFGTSGYAVFNEPAVAQLAISRVLVRADGGAIVVLSASGGIGTLVRPTLISLKADGFRDLAQFPGGIRASPFLALDTLADLASQSNGKLVSVGGIVPPASTDPFASLPRTSRVDPSATAPDTSYGSGQTGSSDIPLLPSRVVISRDGAKIFIGGRTGDGQGALLKLR